jgi:CheY-like chemotaxis protein/HPt (histidine-containing phosphotransfer) domain-containing protein
MGAEALVHEQRLAADAGVGAGDLAVGTSNDPLVLVVDDDPLNRTVMSAILQKAGYRFHLATNGREAIEAVFRDAYAAVLMDCLMPEIDGYEATAMIRQHEREHLGTDPGRHLPIIAVTAVAIPGARERCIEAGMDDYLSKPVAMRRVVDLLNHWVRNQGTDVAQTAPTPDAPGLTAEEVVDSVALDAIRELDPESGDALIAELVHDFEAEVLPRMRGLHGAAARGDLQTMRRDLHFVAGCASILGAMRVERLARSYEAESALERLDGPRGCLVLATQVEDEVLRARSVLESIVATFA